MNVRLDEARLRKAQKLRDSGVALSDLVREAIDERFEALRQSQERRDARTIMKALFERHPDPQDLPPRTYDVSDAKAARNAIGRKLGHKRP